VRLSRHLGIADVKAEVLVPISVVVKELRLAEISGGITHIPTGRRVIDLAHELVGETRLSDPPLRDNCEDVSELLGLFVHKVNEVAKLIEEFRLAHDGVRQRIA
jgi:hypothetical protein